MGKRILCTGLIAFLLLALVGCGANSPTGGSELNQNGGATASAPTPHADPNSIVTSPSAQPSDPNSTVTNQPDQPGDPNGIVNTPAPSGGAPGDSGVVSSDGTTIPDNQGQGGGVSGSVPGSIDPVSPSYPGPSTSDPGVIVEPPGAYPAPAEPTKWLEYRDEQYGFSIGYPDTFVILDEPQETGSATLPPLRRVRFQERSVAAGDLADVTPAQFSIEVFARDAAPDLDQLIAQTAPSGTTEQVTLADRPAAHLTLMTMQAPNEFYYLATDSYYYKLTPLGPYSQEMLKLFKLS